MRNLRGLSLAAFGLGAGAANADDGNIPFVPPGGAAGDWQSYFPMVENFADIANMAKIGDIGSSGNIPDLGSLGTLANLGGLGNLGNGQVQQLLGLLGG